MAAKELYGNWQCPPPLPGKSTVRQGGTYLSERSADASHFQSGSLDSCSDEEDYDDVAVPKVGDQMQQRLSVYEGNADTASQRSKKEREVYALVRKVASSGLPTKAVPLPDSNQGRGYKKKSIVMLYILMGLCFAMWAVLLSLAVVKYSEMSEELKTLNYTHSQRLTKEMRNLTHMVWKELAEMRQNHDRLQEALSRAQEEIRNITEFICTKCPRGWQQFEKTCYFFSTLVKSWSDAKQSCANEGSQLVIVNTLQEHVFLSMYVINPHAYWLGLSDSAKEGEWQWVDGSPLSLKFWADGEPNNTGEDKENGEDCGTLRFDRMWNDMSCSVKVNWICERGC